MGKFNLLTTLSLNASGMSAGLKASIAEIEKYVNETQGSNNALTYSFRDVSEMGIGEMRKELVKLRGTSFAGKTPQEIQVIKDRMGELTDTMGDLRAEIQVLGGPGIGAVIGGFQFLSASVEGTVGALSVFGVESEVVRGLEKKMAALIGVTQALGVMEDYVNSGKLRAIALKIRGIFVTQAETAATVQATAAQRGLNLAMLANPYALALAGMVALGVGLVALAASHQRTVPEIDKTSEAYQALIDKQKELLGLSTDLVTANEDAVNKMLVDSGQMTEKQYNLQKINADKIRKLNEVNAKEQEAIRAAQVAFEQTAGYTFANLEADKAKAVADANSARAEIIKEAYLLEQGLNKTSKKTAEDTRTEYEKLNAQITDVNKNIQNYILLGKDASGLIKLRAELETKKLAVDLVVNQIELRDSGGLINAVDMTEELQAALDEAVESINVEPIPVELKPINTSGLIDLKERANLAAGAINGISDAFVAMAGDGEVSFKAVVQATLAGIRQIIVAKLAEAIMGQTASNSKYGIPGLILAGVGITGVMAIFNSLPKFATGGLVGGNSLTGDRVPVMVNSREMILNQAQQAELFDIANGRGAGGGVVRFEIEGSKLVGAISNYSKKTNSYR